MGLIPNLGLWYPRESPLNLEAFSDSDYGGSNLDRKSTTGGCQLLGKDPQNPFMVDNLPKIDYKSCKAHLDPVDKDLHSLTLNELTALCTTLSKKVEDLQNDLQQTKLTYGAAYTKLILRVKKLEHKTQGRTSVDTEILLEREEPTELVEDPSSGEKGEKEITTAEVLVSIASGIPEVSTAIPERQVYIRRSAEKRIDKGKAIMKDVESVQKKIKKQLEQKRLGHEEAIRL
ncbi:hypothetical protein Tco_1521156, partial [Tanacetum coccineum]